MSKVQQFSEILREVDTVIQQGIQEKVFPGASLWIGWRGETVKCAAYGKTAERIYDTYTSGPVTTKTLYDLASLTKVVATTCAIIQLKEQGLLRLADPISKYLPDFGMDQQKAVITIKQALTHTSGLPGPLKLYEHFRGENQIIEGVYRQELVFPPGTSKLYNDLGFILLGKVVQVISSLRLDEYTRRYIFEPLGMKDTMFAPPKMFLGRIAPTEDVAWRGGLIHGEVHDENAWAMGGVAGHAGLFSTVEDLSRFCTMLLCQGDCGSKEILHTDSLLEMESVQVSAPDESFGLGWMINAPYFMGSLASDSTFGHTGFTGTAMILNRKHQLALVLLTNRVCPTRNGPSIQPYRQKVANVAAKLCRI